MSLDAESLPARMAFGAFAGMGAASVVHPFDLLRVQMQTSAQAGEANLSICGTGSAVLKRDGFFGLYNGLSAVYLGEIMDTSARYGIYAFLLNRRKQQDKAPPTFAEKLLYGAAAGAVGAFVGNPSEVAMVRMAADAQMPMVMRRNYRGIFDCMSRIAKQEGMLGGLGKGCTVSVVRAAKLDSARMATYSTAKDYLHANYGDVLGGESSIATVALGSSISSLVATAVSMPLDNVKSRFQNSPKPVAGQAPMYTGAIDCSYKVLAEEGLLAFWRGFTPAYFRLTSYTIISFTLLEKLSVLATGKAAL